MLNIDSVTEKKRKSSEVCAVYKAECITRVEVCLPGQSVRWALRLRCVSSSPLCSDSMHAALSRCC